MFFFSCDLPLLRLSSCFLGSQWIFVMFSGSSWSWSFDLPTTASGSLSRTYEPIMSSMTATLGL